MRMAILFSSCAAVAALAIAGSSGAEAIRGSHLDGNNFKLDAVGADCKAGAECKVTVKLEALGEFHINKEFPYKFTANEAAGVEFHGASDTKRVFSKANGDFKEEGEKVATMTLKFKPAKAGNVTIGGVYAMSVCSPGKCQLEKSEISVTVPVK